MFFFGFVGHPTKKGENLQRWKNFLFYVAIEKKQKNNQT